MTSTAVYWSFVEKTTVKQDPNPKCVQIFRCPFYTSARCTPLVEASQISLTFGQPVGQADLLVRCTSPVEAAQVSLTLGQADLQVRCTLPVEAAQISFTFGQPLGQANLQVRCTPLIEASSGKRSALHLVTLTFSQMYPPVQASDGQE